MGKIVLFLILLISMSAQASSVHPPGYLDDAIFISPTKKSVPIYQCNGAVRNVAKKDFGNISYGACVNAAVDFYLSMGPAWNVKDECAPNTGQITIYCSFSSNITGHNGVTGLSVAVAEYYSEGASYDEGCYDPLYTDAYDSDKDGNVDRCYDPSMKSSLPIPSNKFCKSEPNAFTLSSEEEDKIKSAARLAKQSLERMEADLAAPNEINSGKLNQIASLFGIENYQDPQFAILTTAIQSGSIGCVKNKLDAASLDPSGNGYLSFEDANGGVSGVHCKDKNGDDIIQVHVKDISHFHPVYANQAMQELLGHETQHGCNDVHPLNMHYMEKSEIRSKFDTQVQSYKNLVGSGNELDILKRLIKNPYYFEYLLKVYL